MSSIKNYLSKVYFIIQEKKIYIFLLLFSFVTLSILDIVGISLVTAFMSLLLGSENFIFDTIKKIFDFFSISKEESFLNILIISILILYICKAVVSFLIQAWIIKAHVVLGQMLFQNPLQPLYQLQGVATSHMLWKLRDS